MSHKDTNTDDQLVAEHDAMDEAEVASPHQPDEADTEDAEVLGMEAATDTSAATPAELAAVHTDTDAASEASGDTVAAEPADVVVDKVKATKKAPKSPTVTHQAARSRRYQDLATKFDRARTYEPEQAIELAKETAVGKFDQVIELHIRLTPPKGKKGDVERYRTIVTLPHGTGKEPKIGVLDEAMIDAIAKKGDTEFDILLASPDLMPKVAKIAKILGPKNKMPNPKTGTVTDNPEAAKAAIVSGRIEVRADADHNLHQAIGRASWSVEKLLENYRALKASLPQHRLQRAVVCATFGPGIAVDLSA